LNEPSPIISLALKNDHFVVFYLVFFLSEPDSKIFKYAMISCTCTGRNHRECFVPCGYVRISYNQIGYNPLACSDDIMSISLFCAAIIELFHLLPAAAWTFLDELVTLTIELERALPPGQVYSEINSPYHLPLTKFLNRYATEAVEYFLNRLSEPKYFRR
jgi:hypothetical protein